MEKIEEKILQYYRSLKFRHISEFKEQSFYSGKYWVVDPVFHDRGYAVKRGGTSLLILNWPNRIIDDLHWEQEWLDIGMGDIVESTIKNEEKTFLDIVKKFDDIEPQSLKPEKAVKLWHSQGCPIELTEELTTDKIKFKELVEQHKETGRKGDKFETIY